MCPFTQALHLNSGRYWISTLFNRDLEYKASVGGNHTLLVYLFLTRKLGDTVSVGNANQNQIMKLNARFNKECFVYFAQINEIQI